MPLLRRVTFSLVFVVATGVLVAPPASAGDLTITGKVTHSRPGMSVLAVGSSGASFGVPVRGNGTFKITVKGRALKRLAAKNGEGLSLHLVRGGRYVGPVVLARKGRKGYDRLAPGTRGPVSLGKLRFRKPGFLTLAKSPTAGVVDTTDRIRLRKGVPLGAGNQGATKRLSRISINNVSRLRPGDNLVTAQGVLPATQDTLGADADADGVPNVADVDMNGDAVLDAAQADAPMQVAGGGVISGNAVLTNRPRSAIVFSKILSSDNRTSVNTNKNPGLTWPELTEYLKSNLMIQAIIAQPDMKQLLCGNGDDNTSCPAYQAVATAQLSCPTLSYCAAGTPARITASPGSQYDQQPLSALFAQPGLIDIPLDTHVPGSTPQTAGFQLAFRPNLSNPRGLQFTGDSFELILADGSGTELARQAKVLTSSVSAPMDWKSVGGRTDVTFATPVQAPASGGIRVEFYRPQSLAGEAQVGDAPILNDRGGLQYKAYLMGHDNGFWWCRASQVTPTTPDLVKIDDPMAPPEDNQKMFDTNVTPANGGVLGFDIDVAGCLRDPARGPGASPAPGANITLEIEAVDADSNAARTNTYLLAP
jgi:hypothetical protein